MSEPRTAPRAEPPSEREPKVATLEITLRARYDVAVDASHVEEMQQAAEERAARHALEIMNLKAERNAADRRLAEVEKERDAAEAALSELRAITEPWQTVHHLDPHQCVFGRFHPVEEVDLARQAERAQFRVELTALREELAAVQQERDEKAAMHNELATLAGSAIVLATLDTLAGERPTQEPEHALPAAVWRLVQDRDEARAANTANLREMVGMAGRFRQTLQTVRACIVALTPGHRTGYDWNADPLYLTRKEGEALSAIDAALSSPSTQEPQTQHWGVEVRRNGETLVTIESNCLSGKPEFSEVEADVIRECADHLHAFIGPRSTQEPQTVCEWRDISTAPERGVCWFWLELKAEFAGHQPPHALRCERGGWPSIYRATHWQPYEVPSAPLKLSPESPKEVK